MRKLFIGLLNCSSCKQHRSYSKQKLHMEGSSEPAAESRADQLGCGVAKAADPGSAAAL